MTLGLWVCIAPASSCGAPGATVGRTGLPLDLVCRAFAAVAAAGTTGKTDTKDASVDDATTITCSAAAASSAATKEVTKLLPRWIKAYEESDWKCMAVIGKLFTHISETVGQIIIEDKAALAHIRTFFPRAMGGIAGGKKFMEKEMLMKVRYSDWCDTRVCEKVWCEIVVWRAIEDILCRIIVRVLTTFSPAWFVLMLLCSRVVISLNNSLQTPTAGPTTTVLSWRPKLPLMTYVAPRRFCSTGSRQGS